MENLIRRNVFCLAGERDNIPRENRSESPANYTDGEAVNLLQQQLITVWWKRGDSERRNFHCFQNIVALDGFRNRPY